MSLGCVHGRQLGDTQCVWDAAERGLSFASCQYHRGMVCACGNYRKELLGGLSSPRVHCGWAGFCQKQTKAGREVYGQKGPELGVDTG